MTGQPKYYKRAAKEPDYTYVLVHFTNEYTLAFRMPRKLGSFQLIKSVESFVDDMGLGPDVLREDFDVKRFLALLDDRRGKMKWSGSRGPGVRATTVLPAREITKAQAGPEHQAASFPESTVTLHERRHGWALPAGTLLANRTYPDSQ